MAREVLKYERALEQAGFVHVRTSASHKIWHHPDGRRTVTGYYYQEKRSLQNLRAKLRQLGVEVPR